MGRSVRPMIRLLQARFTWFSCWTAMTLASSARADLMASWTFENTLVHGAAAPGILTTNATEANLAASAAYNSDYLTGAACREYPGNAVASSNNPSSGSMVSFTITATGNTTITLDSARWWTKARSLSTGTSGTHSSARSRLYWSIDNFTAPVSAEVNAVTDTQLGDGTWIGPWVPGNADFHPVTLTPGESVTFRLIMWDSSSSSNHRLRLENFEVRGSIDPGPADEFDSLRQKWLNYLTGGASPAPDDPNVASKLLSINQAAITWRDSLNREANRSHLWADQASTTISAAFHENYVRLRAMALAHATPGCALYQNEPLRQDILSGIDWMRANRYFAGKARYDNWWHWEIGAPQRLGELLLLMHDHLGTTRLAENLGTLSFFVPGTNGWMTGANRSDKCLAAAIHGLLARRSDRLTAARDELTPVFPYVTTGDGFRADGSFIQHTAIAYTGSYGAELIKGVARLYALLRDTPWQLTDPQHEILFDWITRGYAPLYFRGAMPDHVRGRAISRSGSTDHSTGHYILRSILQIADAAPPERGTPIRAWIRQQALSDTSRDFVTASPLPDYPAALALMADESLAATPPPDAHIRFREMDRVVHRRAGYAFGLSMSSSRVYTYESLNQENLRGWFTGDGMLTFHNRDLSQFERDFWPTVDPHHLPGVTNPTAARADASGERKYTGQDWVGGADIAGFGSAGMRLNTWTGDLTARKSWFFLDEEVVCLGSDITGSATSAVHTTIENRRLSDSADEALVIDGAPAPPTLGWQETRTNPSWIALEGTGGIWFPQPLALNLRREARTGTWNAINRGYSSTPVTRNYLTAWIDHGTQPAGAQYAYVLLPDADAAATSSYAASPGVEILANNSTIQAVRDQSSGVTAAHFWDTTGGVAGVIACDGPAAIVTRRSGPSLEIAVADPTWKRNTPLRVTLAGTAGLPLAADPAVTVLGTSPDIVLSIATAGSRGRSITATFTALAPEDDFVSISPGSSVLLDALANDRSLDGSPVSLAAVGPAVHGQAAIRGGAVFYQPDPGFTGVDSFVYQIVSGASTASAVIRIEVAADPGPAAPVTVAASAHDGNVPANALDGNLQTRWSALGDGQWIQFDFGAPRLLDALSLAFYLGASRTSTFEVAVSGDGSAWTAALPRTISSGTTTGPERFDFPVPVFARHLRVTGHGNSSSMWNSITEAVFHASRHLPPPAPSFDSGTPESVAITLEPLALAPHPDPLPGPPRLLHSGNPANGSVNLGENLLTISPDQGFVGSESIIYQTSDGHLVSEGEIRLTITRPTTLAGFLNFHFETTDPADQRSAFADPDEDGLANAIEFLTGSDPRAASPRPGLPLRAHDGGDWVWHLLVRNQPDGSPAEFTGPVSPGASIGGVRCSIEGSTDLATWPDVPITAIPPAADLPPAPEGFGWHAFRIQAQPRAFLRLSASE